MAINIKEILVNGLLTMVETRSLENITIKQLLEYTGVSRQTFYNHFEDKNDLIQYIYLTKIIPDYNDSNMNINFRESLLVSFENMKKYHKFMKQACLMEGQNCLKDYIFDHCKEFDLKWHQKLYGKEKMSDALKFATEYHANASTSMTLSWILSDMPVSAQEIADMITKMRGIGMDKLFEEGEHGNPYHN
ncbi:MAG: TetR/AcrR family transcriptional regulator C-terminal domain-containing protein [Bacilli bacterium]|nr:TetR/AcrR family transcriptional regulator C-terminal domain-containing protein [Bacilli bacterium]